MKPVYRQSRQQPWCVITEAKLTDIFKEAAFPQKGTRLLPFNVEWRCDLKTHTGFTDYLPHNNMLPDFSQLIKTKGPLDLLCNCGNEPEIRLLQ